MKQNSTLTPYQLAWINFKKSDDYRISDITLKEKGIKQPYRNNILKLAFAAGWCEAIKRN